MEPYATLIIGYRRADLVAAVLNSLAAQTVSPTHVILVDNGGDLDEALLDATPFAANSTFVRRPDNPGYSAAVNEARLVLDASPVAHLLVLTHDAVFDATLAETLLRASSDPRRPGAIAPVLHIASRPERVFSAGGSLTRSGRASHSVTVCDGDTFETDWIDGAIVMYRREALDAIDWLDERYFLYFEDVDTSWRLRRAGWPVMVAPAVVAYQEPGAHPMYLGVRNMTLFAGVAGISRTRNLLGVTRRVAEEAVYRLLNRRSPALIEAWRGWRDGSRGISGKPQTKSPHA